MAEWLKATVLKTVGRKSRGFESYSLRQYTYFLFIFESPETSRAPPKGHAGKFSGLLGFSGGEPADLAGYPCAGNMYGLRAVFRHELGCRSP